MSAISSTLTAPAWLLRYRNYNNNNQMSQDCSSRERENSGLGNFLLQGKKRRFSATLMFWNKSPKPWKSG